MRKTIPWTAAVLVSVMVTGCSCEALWCQKDRRTPEELAEARRAIVAWLECEECTNGELKVVKELGPSGVSSLEAVLEHGPSAASREALRRRLTASYKKLVEARKRQEKPRPIMAQETYVQTYLDNYEALYRVRAARALAAIGGEDAKRALQEALEKSRTVPYRKDVQHAIAASLEQLQPTSSKHLQRTPMKQLQQKGGKKDE